MTNNRTFRSWLSKAPRRAQWLGVGVLGLVTAACGGADEGEVGGDEGGPRVTLGSDTDAAVIATIRFEESDTTITLREVEGDGVALLEDAPLGTPSPMDELVVGQRATPLELFIAAAPADLEAPQILVEHHQHLMEFDGRPAPRRLSIDRPAAHLSVAAHTYNVAAADCSFASDGSFFDGGWQALGWDWHWYNYFSAFGGTDLRDSPATNFTTEYRAHVCNGGKKDHDLTPLGHSIARQSDGACDGSVLLDEYQVGKDRRARWNHWATQSCRYKTWAHTHGTAGYPQRWSMGIMAP
jgi:hypothetical protein